MPPYVLVGIDGIMSRNRLSLLLNVLLVQSRGERAGQEYKRYDKILGYSVI